MEELIENIKVSYFPSKESPSKGEMTIRSVFEEIEGGKYKTLIESIRREKEGGNEERSKEIKGTLPAVTFSGLYPIRRADGCCTQYNSLMVIDIDKLENEKINVVRERLLGDQYVIALWKSPSGNGFKGLIKLDFDVFYDDVPIHDKHRTAFYSLYTYLLTTYGIELDRSGSDPTRLCFMSYDPELVIRGNAIPYIVSADDIKYFSSKKERRANDNISLPQQKSANHEYNWNKLRGQKWEIAEYKKNKQTLYSICKKMKSKNISITSTFEDWVKVAFAIANSMHPDVGYKMFMQKI